jgi:competence protein ComEA
VVELSRLRLLVAGLAIALLSAVVTLVVAGRRAPELVIAVEPAEADSQITVYVGGAVATPGLYSVTPGTRVADVLQLAGTGDDADLAAVPMAAELHYGQQVIVPPKGTGTPIPAALNGGKAKAATPKPQGLINVNVAPASELEALPGVGPVLAQRIVDYRTTHGPFKSLDDVVAVSGVSSRMVESWTGLATTEP